MSFSPIQLLNLSCACRFLNSFIQLSEIDSMLNLSINSADPWLVLVMSFSVESSSGYRSCAMHSVSSVSFGLVYIITLPQYAKRHLRRSLKQIYFTIELHQTFKVVIMLLNDFNLILLLSLLSRNLNKSQMSNMEFIC